MCRFATAVEEMIGLAVTTHLLTTHPNKRPAAGAADTLHHSPLTTHHSPGIVRAARLDAHTFFYLIICAVFAKTLTHTWRKLCIPRPEVIGVVRLAFLEKNTSSTIFAVLEVHDLRELDVDSRVAK